MRPWAVLLGAAMAGSGCAPCEKEDRVIQTFELAEFAYKNKKYSHAKQLYMDLLDRCPDHYEAWLGLANASREYGNDLFRAVDQLVSQNKREEAKKELKEAEENHRLSEQFLRTAAERDSDDMRPHYALGLLWYHRAASPVDYPYRRDDKHRQDQRDRAIKEFEIVLKNVPDQLYQARRYLGLTLFAAGRMDEGRHHLMLYHGYQEKLYHSVLRWPGDTDMRQQRKDAALRDVENDIEEIREVLKLYHENLLVERRKLGARGIGQTEEDRERLAKVGREILVLENIFDSFSLTRLGPEELDLWKRTTDYLKVFNEGKIDEILAFATASPGEEARVRLSMQEKLARGTRYERARYKSAVVSGEMGSVGFVCDLVTRKDVSPEKNVTLRWRRIGGRWLVSEHP